MSQTSLKTRRESRRRQFDDLLERFEKRESSNVVALEKVEGEVDQPAVAGIGWLLHQLERGHAVFADAAECLVEVG